MKLKKYVGNTMPEIMKQIRTELGPDAVILNTKEVQQGGIFGFFTKKKLEVVAALDPEPIQVQNKRIESTPIVVKEHKETENDSDSVLREIHQLKKMIQTQVKNDELEFGPENLLIYEYLREQEVEEGLAKQLVHDIKEQTKNSDSEIRTEQLVFRLKQLIEGSLDKYLTKHRPTDAQIIHFVGPTGVGKTTTLAKVAANSILQENKKVAFITTDTYRIAAIEQLKTYAKILDVPLEVAYTNEDYAKAIEKFSAYDHIYVDTAGRNFRDNAYVKDLKKMIDLNTNTQTYLVLSLTAKQRDIIDIFNEFKLLNVKDIIFTKVDETRQYGSVLNIVLKYDVNVVYLTDGQDVPNDLIVPTAKSISELVLGDYFNE